MTFAVLFVCTGNICRSPMAERLFAARVNGPELCAPSSAGTNGLTGHGMDPPSALVLRELGGDPDGHVARRLAGPLLEQADLVLTADAGHRAAALRLTPLAFRRVFTLREFARLGAGLGRLDAPDVGGLRARVAEIAGRRGFAEPVDPATDGIGDPFGATLEVARRSGQQVSQAVDGALAALGLPAAR